MRTITALAAASAAFASPAMAENSAEFEQKMQTYCERQAEIISPNSLKFTINGYGKTTANLSVAIPEQDPDCDAYARRVGASFRFIQPANDNKGTKRNLSKSLESIGTDADYVIGKVAINGCKKSDGKSRRVQVEGRFIVQDPEYEEKTVTQVWPAVVQRCR